MIKYHCFSAFSGLMLWWSGYIKNTESIVIDDCAVKMSVLCLRTDKTWWNIWELSNITPNVILLFNMNIKVIIWQLSLLMFIKSKSWLWYRFQTYNILQPSPNSVAQRVQEKSVCVDRAAQPRKEHTTLKRQSAVKCVNWTDRKDLFPISLILRIMRKTVESNSKQRKVRQNLHCFLSEKVTVQARWGHMLNPWSVAMPLECGASQEIGPHGLDHREQNEGQWHNLSSLSLFNWIWVLQHH